MASPEQPIDPSVYQGERFEAEISETSETFTALIRTTGETVVFTYTPPGKAAIEIVSFAPPGSPTPEVVTDDRPQIPASSPEPEPTPETEHTVKLYGRCATEPFRATAPSGEPMVIVSFAEHPSWDTESHSNIQAEKVKDDTRYWQVAAFGAYAHVLDDLPKGKASILIGYPKTLTKVGKGGQEETVKNGFQVVDRKPFQGIPTRRSREGAK